jgi:hypothetical protein
MTFTHQILDTRFPVPDHQLILVAVIVIVAVTVIAITYEQYPNIVPADPNRMKPVDAENSREVFKDCGVSGQSVLFTS